MKGSHLLKLHEQSWSLQEAGRTREAAAVLRELLDLQPDWEHGGGWHNLAGWYEDLGEIEQARQAYRRALTYSPHDSHFAGGYASFEYLHGDPELALELHLNHVRIERRMKSAVGYDRAVRGLRAAAARAGLADSEVDKLLASVADQGAP